MTTEELKLLPCPHCGHPATLWAVDMSEGVYVFCDGCGMRGPLTEEMTEHEAVAAWNALPRRTLRWSREFPTQPGKYWHRNNYLAPHVTNVDTAFIKRAASVENVDNEEFAGPLPEPEGDG